ncbi:MAG: hypothetical protein DLM72_08705 [Candidatus Nitrosopolaris wilkensis]|nr:MAG: hypothetical protein DLM72_08705 [Candidatus Nitrosopolaris wilkensis]
MFSMLNFIVIHLLNIVKGPIAAEIPNFHEILLDITKWLDDFIAGPNDDVERLLDWVFDAKPNDPEHRPSPARLIVTVRVSMNLSRGSCDGQTNIRHWRGTVGDNPHFQVPCFVLSHDVRGKMAKERNAPLRKQKQPQVIKMSQ